ncbi:MAG: 2-oxo acid dehydrogenase subunit E2 [Actinomycetota bacterium]|nr:2-oxo acid dehydrogenase subunit E2 [Actinomycetota bacterium]
MPDFKLPDLGEGVTEAEVDRWLVNEGDVVSEDDPLVELITDKATAEIPSPYEGVVSRIHVKAGEVVPVGTVLITIGERAASDGAPPPPPPPPAATAAEAPAGPSAQDARSSNGAAKAMPPVRKLARELGVDIAALTGSGPGGRIRREDVEAAAAAHPSQPPTRSALGERREPLRGVRRLIAERMSAAHRIVPPVTHVEECDVTELDATRNLVNERNPGKLRLTYMPFIVKAVVAGLKAHPALNASLDDDAGEIVFHERCDIGIAVDTPAGLVVPVVRDADRKRLREVAEDVDRLARAAREGTLRSEDLKDPTFTISSPGPFGGLMATPIVFHPQSAILGVHRASERPVVRDGQIVIRQMMNLSITFDHRVLDGMTAAKFVLDVAKLLEHPAALALEG